MLRRPTVLDVAGKLKQHIRSELPPKKQNPRVLTVVGSTFHSLITSSDKDTLIMFRSPDCHMCNEIAEEVAQTALRMEWMVPGAFQAAIIDATLNDYPTTYKVPRLVAMQATISHSR